MRPLSPSPSLPRPSSGSLEGLSRFDSVLTTRLTAVLSDMARAINQLAPLESITAAPIFKGQIAISAGDVYIAVDTVDATDWVKVN